MAYPLQGPPTGLPMGPPAGWAPPTLAPGGAGAATGVPVGPPAPLPATAVSELVVHVRSVRRLAVAVGVVAGLTAVAQLLHGHGGGFLLSLALIFVARRAYVRFPLALPRSLREVRGNAPSARSARGVWAARSRMHAWGSG